MLKDFQVSFAGLDTNVITGASFTIIGSEEKVEIKVNDDTVSFNLGGNRYSLTKEQLGQLSDLMYTLDIQLNGE